ncbi:MAG: ATP-dependent helicase HrpA, partial [Cellvibrionaceae bacterium]
MAVPTLSSKDPFQRYRQQLTEVASHQRHGLYQALERLAKRSDDLHSQDHVDARIKFEARLQASLDWVQNRANLVPDIEFPPALPIVDKRTAIAEAIEANPVVIIAGETGSGKTTQLPKICLTLGRGVRGAIAHTQPRRIAARSVASRIAEELKTPLGGLVGYQVRFDGRLTEQTAIRLMTDGILLAEIQRDRYLSRYDTLIIDEAHERSLNIDFLLGYIKQLLPKRPDLKVIVTSATIDVEKFSRYFNDAPILSVSGRVYPVDVIYRPLADMAGLSMTEAIADCVQEICATDKRGDILIFLPGERDIREAALQLRRLSLPHLAVVPLYSRLSLAEQNKIFQAHSAQRVVLSTNVAETSLTVPGITYVIDPGYARISRYSHRTKIQRLPIEAISQASANQRKGRCGRQSEGVCFRLYSEEDFLSRPKFTDPEILRTDLSAVILQMTHLKLGDVRRFSFIDHPDDRTINGAYKRLQELQAVNEQKNLTDIGRQLVRLPLDPGLARILLAAEVGDCLTEIIAIVSALAIQDPRERPADKQQAADQAHRQFWHEASDFLFWLNLWREYHQQIQQLSNNQLQKWCHKHYLAPNRMREWRDIHRQIVIAAKSLSLRLNTTPAEYAAIHTALLSGLLGNIASKTTEKDLPYQGARNRRFSLHPGSSQYKKGPRWILAGQLIETNRLYAHTVALIEPQWLISVAGHLLIYRHDQPHYQPHSGQVMAYE